jgi:hypothetical protein
VAEAAESHLSGATDNNQREREVLNAPTAPGAFFDPRRIDAPAEEKEALLTTEKAAQGQQNQEKTERCCLIL